MRPVAWFRSVIAPLFVLLLVCPAFAQDKDKKKDPDEIGNRDVGRGVNSRSRLLTTR